MAKIAEITMLAFQEELKTAASVKGTLKAVSAFAKEAPKAVGRFAQRQTHAMTGWKPKGGIEAIRGGAWDARQHLNSAEMGGTAREIRDAANSLKAHEAVQNRGMTSLPGYAKAVMKHGPVDALKKDFSTQWTGQGRFGKVVATLPALDLAHTAVTKENEEGPGKGEQIGRGVGGLIGGVAGSSVPLSGQLLLGGALGAAGGAVGRGVDRLRGRVRPSNGMGQTMHNEQLGQHLPTERVMTPGSQGHISEGVGT